MKKKQQRDREHAVTAHLKGESITAIANKLGYTRPWVYKWVKRYQAQVEQEEWQADKAKRPLSNSRQLPGEVVEAVKQVRQQLSNEGLFCGAQAIGWELIMWVLVT